MFSFFKKSLSISEFADITWEQTRNWPAKHGNSMKEDFPDIFENNTKVFDEMVYFFSFSADLAFYSLLKGKPQIQATARDTFGTHLRNFALEHHCQPLPPGDWVGDSMLWVPSGPVPIDIGRPLANLDRRFTLYTEAIKRQKDKSIGVSLAHLLAVWCGTIDFSFIVYSSQLFLGCWKGVQETLDSVRVKP